MTDLVVKSCGPMTSLQDRGRLGYEGFGVSPSGAMDRRALAMANALVGNAPETAAVEFMNLGGAFMCEGGDLHLALVGAGCALSIDGAPVDPQTSVVLKEGQSLEVGHPRTGTFAYLAVAGGFAVEPELGSLSFHLRSRLGGLKGAPLKAEDRLPCRPESQDREPMQLALDPPEESGPIRVMMGPQDDYFTPETIRMFLESEFAISPQADRMGFQLTGPRLEHAKGFNIVSDGIVDGHIQVPGSGQPIVLMRDRQTAGGYPKIATMISADLARFAQMRPGMSVRFTAVERDEAVAAARRLKDWMASLPSSLTPVRFALTTEHLLSRNLIGGTVDALAPATTDPND
ncbi:biotin-dependent carboxyltransferase family protein [Microvirga tunisiensis]|uniref:Biotin-dependent carboxyltransferase family protein n=1 Tax=Microvirga tunisiensis TaxID=2108360 RepID=A0A5N7MTB5_9HYPH|nr:biotin-dependent carboxyltransferase family protein [Microvirga tunisiensis]MPR11270.1 biotin-dependent carboxyltransferase family protein [Microvirga tunisiensis]MPR29344.1 biotin-dependent carboxyltransferase family protein [Microvirga tunisiensis]